MSDTENGTETTEGTEKKSTENEELGDGGKKALVAEREARAAAEKATKELQTQVADLTTKLKDLTDRDKPADQKQADRIKELETALAQREKDLADSKVEQLRRDVAAEKKVPVKFVTGTTREDMEAAADDALEWRGPEPKKKAPPGSLKSGASTSDDASTKKERAAAALRGLGTNR